MTVLIYVDTEDLEVIWVSDLLARAVARVRPSTAAIRSPGSFSHGLQLGNGIFVPRSFRFGHTQRSL
jgi:hypothetical protein